MAVSWLGHNQKELVMVIAKEQIDEEDRLYHIRKGGKYILDLACETKENKSLPDSTGTDRV